MKQKIAPFSLSSPLPSYRAAEVLKRELVYFLVRERPAPGSKFHTARELARITGRSYGMIRGVLDELLREGWLSSRPGKGMFVGPRIETPAIPTPRRSGDRRIIRLAVMSRAGLSARFWLNHAMLEGMENAAAEQEVAVELISRTNGNLAAARRRLSLNPPDVLVDMIPDEDGVRMIGEAERLGIPCIAAGMKAPDLHIPNVFMDDAGGAAAAVRRLQELGHRRIGFVMLSGPVDWYMADRRQGYLDAMARSGGADKNLIHEIRHDVGGEPEWARDFEAYRRGMRVSAVVFSAEWTLTPLVALVKAGTVEVPRDLSVIVFDQAPSIHDRLGLRVTHVAQPLFEEGRKVVEMARLMADGKAVPKAVCLPCALVEGESIGKV